MDEGEPKPPFVDHLINEAFVLAAAIVLTPMLAVWSSFCDWLARQAETPPWRKQPS
jgi:hypothetical protein